MKYLATLIIIGCVAFFSRAYWIGFLNPPCSKPVTYSLGSFDKRFGLTQSEFLQALREAEMVWETIPLGNDKSGRNLFSDSSTTSEVKVNLIFDSRQSTTNQLNSLEVDLKTDNAEYLSLKSQYQNLKDQYEDLNNNYQDQVSLFEAHNKEYEAQLERWNKGPRTNREKYEELQSAERSLEIELANLRTTESKLNDLVRRVNAKVAELNAKARELNSEVSTYNTLGKNRGDTFTGGLYTSDASGERIDIYEFENHSKLVRLLSHELGHALGLDHVSDKEAIMYELNEGKSLRATAADISALYALCGVQ